MIAAISQPSRRNGFSLAELMVAMVICILITISLFSMVGQTARNHRQALQSANGIADARSLFYFIENDIRSHLYNGTWRRQAAADSATQFVFLRQTHRQEQRSDDPSNNKGDIVLVHYYLAYQPNNSREASQKLFRHVLSPEETDKWLRLGKAAPFPVGNPATDEALLDQVLHFDVKLWERDPVGKWIEWQSTSTNLPSKCDIELLICDEFSAQRLRTESDWKNLSQRARSQELVGADHQVRRFTKSIPLSP